ncbi:hypothetical protein FOA52_012995 [Chlamydomonas sp. UWO 241]|nr:hypothetical protein FOA52_012995 [Chlamydomonas sp. UWO 241]
MLLEVCTDSVEGVRAAAEGGAGRVELCSALSEGGLTPSAGLISAAVAAGKERQLPVFVLIRPRGGDFVFSDDEMRVMAEDVRACGRMGVAGVVIGALSPDGTIDEAITAVLLGIAREAGLDVTFHRAFDLVADQATALDTLIALGCHRVLTSGGDVCAASEQGAHTIAALVARAAGRIGIMAGGGLTPDNVSSLVAATRVTEVHGSARRPVPSSMANRRPGVALGAATSAMAGGEHCDRLATHTGTVRAMAEAARGAC